MHHLKRRETLMKEFDALMVKKVDKEEVDNDEILIISIYISNY